MLTASPITRQSAGKTFSIAISILAVGALLQLGVIGWAYISRFHVERSLAENAASATDLAPTIAQQNTPAPFAEKGLDIKADPFAEATPGAVSLQASTTLPKPTPLQIVPQKPADAEPTNRFEELIVQGKTLRERGDMSTALTRFREAAAVSPRSPIPIAEIAATFEKMGLADKSSEQWRRIYDMGDQAGLYFNLAEAKLKESQARTLRDVVSQAPDSAESEGIAQGMTLGILPITVVDESDETSAAKFTLQIPVKARPQARIDVRDLVIHVLFYDIIDGQTVMQTNANVDSQWITAPADWLEGDTETLAVQYQLPKPDPRAAKRENRKYFGYIVRIYYKGQLQAARAVPERLAQQYPAPPTLPKESDK